MHKLFQNIKTTIKQTNKAKIMIKTNENHLFPHHLCKLGVTVVKRPKEYC